VFEVLLGFDFPFSQHRAGNYQKRHPEKVGTIVRASSEFYGHK